MPPNASSPLDRGSANARTNNTSKLTEKAADKEVKGVRLLTQIRYRIVLLGGIGLGLAAYFVARNDQNALFQRDYTFFSTEIALKSNVQVSRARATIESFSVSTTSLTLVNNTAWPNVTLRTFPQLGQDARTGSQSPLIVLSPSVMAFDRDGWQVYATEHQEWIVQGLRFQGDESIPAPIPLQLHNETASSPIPLNAPGPFSPVWQMSPAPIDTTIVNFDLRSSSVFQTLAASVNSTRSGQLSDFMNSSVLFGASAPTVVPQSILVQPIWQSFAGNAPLVAYYIAVLEWQLYLENLLPSSVKGLVAVLADSQGHSYTFEINGPNATLLGTGDLHDTAFDNMVVRTPLGCAGQVAVEVTNTPGNVPCEYFLYIYPSATLQSAYLNNMPAIFTTTVVLIVVFTAVVFMAYDHFVNRQEERLFALAQRSHAFVMSLFPENVMDRIIAGETGGTSKPVQALAGTAGLRTYLAVGENVEVELNFDVKPIADLFPNCTVMFCDIVGFTAWSSAREPTQVFTLLEAIFHEFDMLARKKGVFKVETVGDCYVAVSGLPEARDDHALVMARYARDCLQAVQELLPKMELSLGPDTGELGMRFGLHSGPVIAGVLRGEKARFQLFGDTMNTCSRIETSGQRNKIQVSQETAEFLKQLGKEDWLKLREDIVTAKGKGALTTYWLLPRAEKLGSSGMSASTSDDGDGEDEAEAVPIEVPKPSITTAKTQRLIDWNCELLLQSLRKIVARRNTSIRKRLSMARAPADRVRRLEGMIGQDSVVVDEIVEVITMPAYDAEAAKDETKAGSTTIPDVAVAELREYVTLMASLYRDNPFHNFEHASHVAMSVSKLMARIIAPEMHMDDDEEEDGGKDLASEIHDHTYGITSDPLTQFACVLAALIHDVDHRGVPNFVLVKEDRTLANAYKNKSVAEQNSLDLAWHTLMDPTFDNLRRCIYSTEIELKRFRQLLVNSVMATDIFDKELSAQRKLRWERAFSNTPSEELEATAKNRKATIVIEHLIQASDVAHTMQHWHIYTKWNERLFAEMYTAYRKGRMENDPSANWYEGEIGFYDNYIIPLAKKLKECGVFGVSSEEYLNYAVRNRSEWERRGREIVAEMIAKVNSQQQ